MIIHNFIYNRLNGSKFYKNFKCSKVDAILTPPEKMLLDGLEKITKRLQLAELQIDETIFILQMYIRYNKALVPETKLKKRG